METLLSTLRATGGRVYLLNLKTGCYESVASRSRSVVKASVDARRCRQPGGWGPLEQVIATGLSVVQHEPTRWKQDSQSFRYGSRLVLPVRRGLTVVGLADMHHDKPGAFREWPLERLGELDPILKPLTDAHESSRVREVLEHTARFRVDLHVSEETVLDNLVQFVADSAGMQYVALRRLDPPNRLTALREHGFGVSPEDSLSFLNYEENYLPFAHVVENHDHWIATDLESDIYTAIREQPQLQDIRSFVACPVLVGKTLWGVLSFGAAIEYAYSDLEVYSLRVLANLVGAAIDATRSADRAAAELLDDAQLFQAVLSADLVAATRHEINDQLEIIGNVRTALHEVVGPLRSEPDRSRRLTRRDVDELTEQEQDLDRAHADLNKIMDTIRLSQKEIDPTPVSVNVRQAWARAAEPFRYRLRRLRLHRFGAERVPESTEVAASFDLLRIVFMHLILNSFDAFERRTSSRRKEIVLDVLGQTAEVVRLRYRDTAGGIHPNTLRRQGHPIPPTESVPAAVFERFVTSKPRGTGIGLASCRAALETMNGSIDLIDWSSGIVFDITLRKPVDA